VVPLGREQILRVSFVGVSGARFPLLAPLGSPLLRKNLFSLFLPFLAGLRTLGWTFLFFSSFFSAGCLPFAGVLFAENRVGVKK